MTSSMYFRINKPKVILESFDDEMVIVNLESGSYYSLNTVGAEIWDLLEKGATVEETVVFMSGLYNGNQDAIEVAVRNLIDELLQEELFVHDTTGETSSVSKTFSPEAASATKTAKRNFDTPELQKYTDMQELLLLDPIHDVDESGWPHKPENRQK